MSDAEELAKANAIIQDLKHMGIRLLRHLARLDPNDPAIDQMKELLKKHNLMQPMREEPAPIAPLPEWPFKDIPPWVVR